MEDRERHQRLMRQFEDLLDLPEREQEQRLAELRAEDAELAESVARMLSADRQGDRLERAAFTPTAVMRGLHAAGIGAKPPPSPPPERIAHYKILKKLGAGGMGEVYAAVDERLGRKVAIKLLPESAEFRTESRLRMLREAQAASVLNHPGIVTLHEADTHDGRLYLVMELVDGESFHALAERGLPPAEALRLVAEAADALAAAHAAGVMHRDVKSENLMRTRAGGVKVLDFGVAKIVGEAIRGRTSAVWQLARPPREDGADPSVPPPAPTSLQTSAGVVMGTPSYMAPEQTLGHAPTPRSEVFSLGVVLYELLTATRPFARGNLRDTITAVREHTPEPPSKKAPPGRVIDARVDAVVMRALARAPEERFADMAEFAAAVRAAAVPEPASAPPPIPRRSLGLWITGAAALLSAAGAIVLAVAGLRREPRPTLNGTARRLTFDPGCEEFPTFTPDGKTLVYDVLIDGDYELVAHDIAGGARRRLTRARGWDYGAAVSPDGAAVAYIHQGESSTIRVLPLAGDAESQPVVLGRSDGYPVWSAAGTVLFGENDRVREWDPASGAGGARDLVVLPAQRRATYLAPFADGKVAVVLGTADQEVAPALALVDGGRLDMLPFDDAAEYPIAASPSGKGLYYQRSVAAGVELVRRPRDGGKAAVLQGGVSATGGLAFTSGGKTLAYSTCKSTSFVARIEAGRVEPLTRAGGWTDGYPTPVDNGHLLFTSDRAGRSQIWRLDVKSGAADPLTPAGTLRPALSPGHHQLAWAVLDPPGIVVADLDAGGAPGPPRRLTGQRGDSGPQFTHDGAHVLFVRLDDAGGDRVWVVPAAGGDARPLSPPKVAVASASPIADEIVWLASRGEAGVDVVASDLAGAKTVVVMTLPPGAFRSLRHSPDGRRLVAIREEADIVEIDRAATPPTLSTVWRGGVESVTAADYARDGKSIVASLVTYEGDVWIVEGRF